MRRTTPPGALAAILLVAALPGWGCGSPVAPQPGPTRTWRMGFAPTPPRPTPASLLENVDVWSVRADLAALHDELPWTELLAGTPPDAILERDKVPIAAHLRSKGLALFFMADLTDAASRGEDPPQLRALGRSITEPAVQQAYRAWVRAVVRRLAPEYIGLAAETNLTRARAPPALYEAVVRAASDAAADLALAGSSTVPLFSVHVETAWDLFSGQGVYAGIDRDFLDFPFARMLGLSSYPCFAFARPEDLPADYYSRLLGGRTLPVMVVEGGWSSASVGNISSSPELQSRYVARHAQLLSSVDARGVIQLQFADPDLAAYPPLVAAAFSPYARMGLTDSDFREKPALRAWDELFARRLSP